MWALFWDLGGYSTEQETKIRALVELTFERKVRIQALPWLDSRACFLSSIPCEVIGSERMGWEDQDKGKVKVSVEG